MELDALARQQASYANNVNNSNVKQNIVQSSNELVPAKTIKGNDGTSKEGYKKESGEAQLSDRHIRSEISKANSKIRMQNTRCEFSFHEATKRVSIKVIDQETQSVIREIPPEKTLEMIERMWELAGIFVDEKS